MRQPKTPTCSPDLAASNLTKMLVSTYVYVESFIRGTRHTAVIFTQRSWYCEKSAIHMTVNLRRLSSVQCASSCLQAVQCCTNPLVAGETETARCDRAAGDGVALFLSTCSKKQPCKLPLLCTSCDSSRHKRESSLLWALPKGPWDLISARTMVPGAACGQQRQFHKTNSQAVIGACRAWPSH